VTVTAKHRKPADTPAAVQDLVTACIAGDEHAWTRLVDLYYDYALSVARQSLRRAAVSDPAGQAEDVVSDLFAELLTDDCKALSRFRAPFSLKSWLGVITRRRASRHVRSLRRAPARLEEPGRIESGRLSVVSTVATSESCAKVQARLEDLAARDRLALQLFYEGGHSYKEVAAVLDLPVNRVGTLLARARTRLVKALCA
jgi:RNA polymerase sigma-70 factor (ECF subfamily)